jgi:HK97 family phage prohead protease
MQVRATPEDGSGTFTALVSAYNVTYDVGWGWTERILPGAFAESIKAHSTIPIFYEHAWADGPLGVGTPVETESGCEVSGRLYLGMAERIDVIYQAMLDEALEEWSVAFWPQTIIEDSDDRYCDQIAKGDLAEASVCVRGANPATETIDLRSQVGWIDGSDAERQKEVVRLRRMFKVPDLRPRTGNVGAEGVPVTERAADDDDEPTAGDLAKAVDALIDQAAELAEDGDLAGLADVLVAADSTVDDLLEALGVPDDDDIDPADNDDTEAQRARAVWGTPAGDEIIRALRSSRR